MTCWLIDFTGTGWMSLFLKASSNVFASVEIGFISRDIGTYSMEWKQNNGMTKVLEFPGPVISAAASFEQDSGRLVLSEETLEDRKSVE